MDIGKTLSYWLRHGVKDTGKYDNEGFVNVNKLLTMINNQETQLTKFDIETYLQNEKKERFLLVDNKIKALYGHSFEVKNNIQKKALPETLYIPLNHNFLNNHKDETEFSHNRNFYYFEDYAKAAVDKDLSQISLFEIKINELSEEMQNSLSYAQHGVWQLDSIIPVQHLNFSDKNSIVFENHKQNVNKFREITKNLNDLVLKAGEMTLKDSIDNSDEINSTCKTLTEKLNEVSFENLSDILIKKNIKSSFDCFIDAFDVYEERLTAFNKNSTNDFLKSELDEAEESLIDQIKEVRQSVKSFNSSYPELKNKSKIKMRH